MENNLFVKIIKYNLLGLLFYLAGCLSQIVSLEEYTKGWVGRPLSEKTKQISRPTSYASRIGWEEKTYRLDNGNLVYVEPDHPDCFIHWEVNPQGIIVGYRTEGSRCY